MSFVDLNGLAVDVALGSFERGTADVESFARTEGLTYEGITYAAKRRWSFEIPYNLTESQTISDEGWIKGRGHYWTFERVDGATTRFNRFSNEGGPGLTATNLTQTGTAKFGTWAGEVAGNLSSVVTATFGSEGRYSASVWRREASGAASGVYRLFTIVANGTTTEAYIGTTKEASGAAHTDYISLSAASGYLSVALKGFTQGAASMPHVYDALMVLPYAMTTVQMNARVNRTLVEPNFPFIEFDGDALEDVSPVTVKGFVTSHELTQAQSGGVTNVRALRVDLIEK